MQQQLKSKIDTTNIFQISFFDFFLLFFQPLVQKKKTYEDFFQWLVVL
jgi:hypothetical protein